MRTILLALALGTSLSPPQDSGQLPRVWLQGEANVFASAISHLEPNQPGRPPLYAIAPVFLDATAPISSGKLNYDLVAEAEWAADARRSISGKVLFLLPGPRANERNAAWRTIETSRGPITLLFAADTDRDGIAEPLTSVAKVQSALGLDLATTQDTEIAIRVAIARLAPN